jgi:7,8-dihydropterin-6-yl-methyl-4-(beta-D-ribofuranosyl)aminobenzene 5'-phosphate synthase
MIKIKVLNNELSNFDMCKSGFSILIKYNDIKILFDTSIGNEIINNSIKFNEKLNDINYVILSHSDHCNGLINLKFDDAKLVTHPLSLKKRFWNNIQVGPSWKLDDIKNKFNEIILTKKPYKLNDNIIFLGEININQFEQDKEIEYFEDKSISLYDDDSALLIKSNKGLNSYNRLFS